MGVLRGNTGKRRTFKVVETRALSIRALDPVLQGMSVKNMIDFRRQLPAGAHLVVAKNTLMVKAGSVYTGGGGKGRKLRSHVQVESKFMFR